MTSLILLSFWPIEALAVQSKTQIINEITEIVNKEKQTDKDVKRLEVLMKSLNIDSGTYFTLENGEIMTRGYGQWHSLGKGRRARVDRPGSKDSKPHVHVEKGGTKATENVDGTNSHGTNMDKKKVPKDIQKKVKNLKDYKKAQKDCANMKNAKKKMKARNLNLKKAKDIIIAIGIFIAVVGLVIFATGSITAWGPFLLAI